MKGLFGSYSYNGKGKDDSLTEALYVGILMVIYILALILHGDINFLGSASDFVL